MDWGHSIHRFVCATTQGAFPQTLLNPPLPTPPWIPSRDPTDLLPQGGVHQGLDAQIANRNRSDLKSYRASELATDTAPESVEKRIEITTEIVAIRIAAISNPCRVGFEIPSDLDAFAPGNFARDGVRRFFKYMASQGEN